MDILILLDKRDRKTFDKIIEICFQIERKYDVVIKKITKSRKKKFESSSV